MSDRYVLSRYTRSIREDGRGRLLYNSYTGAIAALTPEEDEQVSRLLNPKEYEGSLKPLELEIGMREAGFIVPVKTDELQRAQELHDSLQAAGMIHLIIMPTEACNYRCTYCYQTFPRGNMNRQTINGLKTYVPQVVPHIEQLTVSWFGGEPMLAYDTILELSDQFVECCEANGVEYHADMSTNGHLLTKERFEALLDRNVRRFMVTLDGVGAVHDRRRKLGTGGATYDTIIGNLKELREVEAKYKVDIRVNFDEDNVDEVPNLLKELSDLFKGDQRFQLLIRPVGRWGGSQDEHIPVCDRTSADTHLWRLTEQVIVQGLDLSDSLIDSLMPTGSVCYAAKPNSLVIGSGGELYKCSIALADDMNQVGQLHEDGRLQLNREKVALWTGSGEETDSVCRSCFYRPACQGNHCPLYRMRTGKRPCPHEKRKIKQVLKLLWKSV